MTNEEIAKWLKNGGDEDTAVQATDEWVRNASAWAAAVSGSEQTLKEQLKKVILTHLRSVDTILEDGWSS